MPTSARRRLPVLPADQNAQTQPLRTFPVFNNWDVIAKGWYAACLSAELQAGCVRPFELNGQRLVLFRGTDGKARALDAYCPHMGTDLAIGRVEGNTLSCFFHRWRFDGDGRCVDIPCQPQTDAPAAAHTQGYATCERYGWVWVWPEAQAPEPVVEYPELAGEDLVVWQDHPILRSCHHHVGMINGIDPQHLRTVHHLDIDMTLSTDESKDGRVVDFVLTGKVPTKSFVGKLTASLFGGEYTYGMRYADANIGLLTTVKNLRFRGTGFQIPQLYMLYAYTPLERGVTRIQPIFVTKKRKGVVGWLYSRALLVATLAGYRFLQHEDGQVYDNIRFSPNALLPIDGPVAKFITYVNRLEPSRWSKTPWASNRAKTETA